MLICVQTLALLALRRQTTTTTMTMTTSVLRRDNFTYSPTASPTFVIPVVTLYVSSRKVRGDFALKDAPEVVCKENPPHACDAVAALISTRDQSARRRARDMRGAMISFENHVLAHDAAEIWTSSVALDLHHRVWTGTENSGVAGEDRCEDWTSIRAYGIYGGRLGLTDGETSCAEFLHLLCMCKTHL